MPLSQEMAEEFERRKEESKIKRRNNRENAPKVLEGGGIQHIVKNNGAHIIIQIGGDDKIDFWPGTGKWIPRDTQQHERGILDLIRYIKAHY